MTKYYVVEYRLPIQIDKAKDAKDAAEKAKNELEQQLGVRLSSWNTRVFEYSTDGDDVGPVAEYFFGPSGTVARNIKKNIKEE